MEQAKTAKQKVQELIPKAFCHYHKRFRRYAVRFSSDCTLGTGSSESQAWENALANINHKN